MATAPIRILDGGLGTTLEDRYGVVFSAAATPLWSSYLVLADPATLLAAQTAFAAAGADVVGTATYQFSAEGFARTPWSPDVAAAAAIPRLLDDAVSIAEAAVRQAGRHSGEVALALGPYGACMWPRSQEYSGAYDEAHRGADALLTWHAARWDLVASAVPRLAAYVAFETVPRLDEVLAVRRLLAARRGGLDRSRVWISCVFPGDDDRLPDGSSPEDVVAAALGGSTAGGDGTVPWGIGINCTKVARLARLIGRYEAAVAALVDSRQLREWPSLVLYPDGTAAGDTYNTATGQWETAAAPAASQAAWHAQLADIVTSAAARNRWRSILVGGCCKTTDSDIRALRAALLPGEDVRS